MSRRLLLLLILSVVFIGGGLLGAISYGDSVQAVPPPQSPPTLTIGSLVPADGGAPVTVPVDFENGGQAIDAIFFAIAYDATLLHLNIADADNDGIPDALAFNLPQGRAALVETSVVNNGGRIDVLIYPTMSSLPGIPSGRLLDMTFSTAFVNTDEVTDLIILRQPLPFFADDEDAIIEGEFNDGSVFIEPSPPTPTPTNTRAATSTATPTSTATSTTTATATETLTPSPTVTGTPPTAVPATETPTPTATATPTATETTTATPTATRTSRPPVPLFLPVAIYEPPPTATPTPTATATSPAPPTPTATSTTQSPPTATSQPPATATPTRVAGQCVNVVANGGFENDAGWQLNQTAYPAGFVTQPVFSGGRSLRAGIVHPPHNVYSYSSAQQTLFIPAGPPSVTLSFRLFATTTGTMAQLTPPSVVPTSPLDRAQLADDVQMVLLFDSSGRQHVLLFQRQWYSDWRLHQIDLSAFRGQAVTLYFGVFNNGTGGVTGMYVDDVAVSYCLP